jgi:hypothetical protein
MKMRYLLRQNPRYPDLYLSACGIIGSTNRDSTEPWRIAQEENVCLKCLRRVQQDYPELRDMKAEPAGKAEE